MDSHSQLRPHRFLKNNNAQQQFQQKKETVQEKFNAACFKGIDRKWLDSYLESQDSLLINYQNPTETSSLNFKQSSYDVQSKEISRITPFNSFCEIHSSLNHVKTPYINFNKNTFDSVANYKCEKCGEVAGLIVLQGSFIPNSIIRNGRNSKISSNESNQGSHLQVLKERSTCSACNKISVKEVAEKEILRGEKKYLEESTIDYLFKSILIKKPESKDSFDSFGTEPEDGKQSTIGSKNSVISNSSRHSKIEKSSKTNIESTSNIQKVPNLISQERLKRKKSTIEMNNRNLKFPFHPESSFESIHNKVMKIYKQFDKK